jgi:hypothetical protein
MTAVFHKKIFAEAFRSRVNRAVAVFGKVARAGSLFLKKRFPA